MIILFILYQILYYSSITIVKYGFVKFFPEGIIPARKAEFTYFKIKNRGLNFASYFQDKKKLDTLFSLR